MEKISFPPLIATLSHNSALYNQWNNDHEIKYGRLSGQTMASWMVQVVEPIVKSAVAINSAPEKVHEVVKALYLESLKLIGGGLAIRYKNDYVSAWLLMIKIPNLLVKYPTKTISLLNDVLLNLNTYTSEKAATWCALMETTASGIETIEDFKTVGRICAWKCGLAHLRIRLRTDFEALSEPLQKAIIDTIGLDKNRNQIFEDPWPTNITKFEGVQGGFEGTTGFFEQPPMLAQLDNQIFVTDLKNSYALFADHFGKVLIPVNTVDASYILAHSKNFESLEKWLGKDHAKIQPDQISSVVATKNTLVFTLHHSYFIYLYSLGNA